MRRCVRLIAHAAGRLTHDRTPSRYPTTFPSHPYLPPVPCSPLPQQYACTWVICPDSVDDRGKKGEAKGDDADDDDDEKV